MSEPGHWAKIESYDGGVELDPEAERVPPRWLAAARRIPDIAGDIVGGVIEGVIESFLPF